MLRIIGMYRIIVQPFIMVIKGMPFIVTRDLPANAQLPHEGPPGVVPPGASPPHSNPSRLGRSGAGPSSGSRFHS